ncbi:radical SAM protein [Methanimicrococcus blatticola]|uniref:MoaA/NifB/PqqE/SkfB family radical SAM enzyme n=1 Tax=Methanimicrococcus blatticola TaxID=91560 RepID=A0A484F4C9_9EURY|nr:radical SAM protein [Methanimicrococcus blatticola]MBZ3935313.1 radical SAM protein [Methanimicrococcus blatticola]MCC2508589.1 radical SAM protein [Methanimicrococcus blatticola]TDQ67896.1 MoaA/NifB/PqqE/SkfB family radical SAM enzyme [Methanimicrococcus blatticola]
MAKSAWQMKIRRRPVTISHTVNSGCNLRCVFCDEWKKSLKTDDESVSRREPSFEEVCKIIDLAVDFGIGSYNAWSTEPFLRKDLPDIMKYAKSKGMKTFTITNGLLLKKRMHELKDVDYISVSVDGPTATREIRGADYEMILDGIRYASQSGLLNEPLLMNCVISRKNLDEVEDLLRFAKDLGNVKMAVEPLYVFQRMGDTDWDDLSIGEAQQEKFVSLMNTLIDMKKKGYPLINSKTYLKQIRDGKNIKNCRVDRGILAVDHHSNMYNCRIHNKPLGNVIEESVFDNENDEKIVQNGITKVWNQTKKERKEMIQNCEGCRFFGYAELTLMNNYNIESFYGYEWL